MTITLDGTNKAATRTSLGLAIGTDVLSPTGSAAGLTSVPAAQLTGTVPDASLAAATIPAGQLSGTMPAVDGAAITGIEASNIATGTVPAARLGTGASATTFLRGDGTFAAAGGGGAWVKSTNGSFTSQTELIFTDLPDSCRISIQFSNGFGNPLSARVSNDNGSTFQTSNYIYTDAELVPGQTRWVFGATLNMPGSSVIDMGATGYTTIYWQFGQNANLQTLVTWYTHAVQGASASNTQTWTNIGHGCHNINGTTNALRLTQAGAVSGNFSIDTFTT